MQKCNKIWYILGLSHQSKSAVDILLHQLDIFDPYRPMDAFELNTSMALSAFGLISTYTIILLQFKGSE